MNMGMIETLIGATIADIYGLLYERDGVLQPGMAAIWIRCENGAGVRLLGSSDGMHLRCDQEFPWPFDMQEDGAYVLISLSGRNPWSMVRGQSITQLSEVVSNETGDAIGVGLEGGGGCVLFLLHLGDELKVFDVLPSEVVAQENAEVRRTNSRGLT